MEQKYKIGQVVEAKVKRILPHLGVLVLLDDGTRGLIRKRELSWTDKEPDPHRYAAVNQAIKAVVLKQDGETNSLNLSHRFIEKDPWLNIKKNYPEGSVVEGIITDALPTKGAFVELEPGVEGFIDISQIHPDKRVKNVE